MNAKDIKGFLVGAIVVASSISVLAVTIPNSFSAGTPIKASDVNANFSAINTALENHNHVGQRWVGGSETALSVVSSSVNPTLVGRNDGTGGGVLGLGLDSQAYGVKGVNGPGVGVWGKSTNGNGGYFENNSSNFPSLALRQFGSNNIVDAYGPGDAVPEFSLDKDGNGIFRGKVISQAALEVDSSTFTPMIVTSRVNASAMIINQRGAGNIMIGRDANNAEVFRVLNNGDVQTRGVTLTSDRNVKKNFSSIDSQSVLEKVAAMPITRWNYKTDSSSVAHVGPMAQDFHAAFGLNGSDDKHISSIDAQGVALAAIQGLNQKLEAENTKLRSSLTDLEKRLAALERK